MTPSTGTLSNRLVLAWMEKALLMPKKIHVIENISDKEAAKLAKFCNLRNRLLVNFVTCFIVYFYSLSP